MTDSSFKQYYLVVAVTSKLQRVSDDALLEKSNIHERDSLSMLNYMYTPFMGQVMVNAL